MTGFDGMKVADLTAAEFEGRRRMQALLEFARENVPGFERAYFVMGEAAGIAAALALDGGILVRDVDVHGIQRQMRVPGADPGDKPADNAFITEAA